MYTQHMLILDIYNVIEHCDICMIYNKIYEYYILITYICTHLKFIYLYLLIILY